MCKFTVEKLREKIARHQRIAANKNNRQSVIDSSKATLAMLEAKLEKKLAEKS